MIRSRHVVVVIALLCALALSACVTRSGGLTVAQIETLRIREIKFENGIAGPNDIMFRSAVEALRPKIVERLGGRYDPGAKNGYQLVIIINGAQWPLTDGPRTGGENGGLKGIARLIPPGSTAPAATYEITAVEASAASGAVGAGGLVMGLIVSAAMSNIIKIDYRDRVTTRAADSLVQSMLSP